MSPVDFAHVKYNYCILNISDLKSLPLRSECFNFLFTEALETVMINKLKKKNVQQAVAGQLLF